MLLGDTEQFISPFRPLFYAFLKMKKNAYPKDLCED